MGFGVVGLTGNTLEVTPEHEALVALESITNAGFATMAGEVHDGSVGVARLSRPIDVSPDYRTRVGTDSILWHDVFNHGQFNASKYGKTESTMTAALSGGRLAFNSGNSVATSVVARVQTYRTFPLFLSYGLYFDGEILFTQDPVPNNVCEFGLGYATASATPTDGVFFRLNGAGQLCGVTNSNGSETQAVLPFTPASNTVYHYLAIIHNDRCEFWIDDLLYGVIPTPTSVGAPCMSQSLPVLLREYNSSATGLAQRMEVASIGVSALDLQMNRLWATTMAGMGNAAVSVPDGVAAAQIANYANSAAPASATLSNTAAGYTTLGGQWQFAAVAGAETDYALFAYQVPAGAANVPGKTLMVRGLRIEAFNMGAVVAGTPTLLQWAIGFGSTAVSLATADSATAGTRASRRIAVGVQSIPVGAAIGAAATPIDINLDAPILVETGTFIHIILKMPVGTATASQIVRGTCFINAYFE